MTCLPLALASRPFFQPHCEECSAFFHFVRRVLPRRILPCPRGRWLVGVVADLGHVVIRPSTGLIIITITSFSNPDLKSSGCDTRLRLFFGSNEERSSFRVGVWSIAQGAFAEYFFTLPVALASSSVREVEPFQPEPARIGADGDLLSFLWPFFAPFSLSVRV